MREQGNRDDRKVKKIGEKCHTAQRHRSDWLPASWPHYLQGQSSWLHLPPKLAIQYYLMRNEAEEERDYNLEEELRPGNKRLWKWQSSLRSL